MSIIGVRGIAATTRAGVVDPVTQQKVTFETPPSNVTLTRTPELKRIQGYPTCGSGKLSDIASYEFAEEIIANMTWQACDWGLEQLMWDEMASSTATWTFQEPVCITVPGTPFTITDAELAGLTASDITVTRPSKSGEKWIPLKVVTGAPPASGREVQLDNSVETDLVFHSSLEGKEVKYFKKVTYSNIETIGVAAAPTRVGPVEVQGILVYDTAPETRRFRATAKLEGATNMGTDDPQGNQFRCLAQGVNNRAIQIANIDPAP